MDVPELVTDRLDDEEVTGTVDLGGGDVLLTTPTRTLVYRDDGLLRDESIESYSLDVDRVDVSTGRRKATVRLADRDETTEFTVAADRAGAVFETIIGGVLRAGGAIGDEAVRGAYRFSELTLVVTDDHLLKHVGSETWAPGFETYPFDAATGLRYEESAHALQLVLEIDGRPTRIKLPLDGSTPVRRTVESALFDYYEVESLEALNDVIRPAEADEQTPSPAPDVTEEMEGPTVDQTADAGQETAQSMWFDDESGDRADRDLEARVAGLERTLDRQTQLLEEQRELLDQLIEELRRGR